MQLKIFYIEQLAFSLIISLSSFAQSLNIKNDTFWNTKDGRPIYSQGGGIFKFADPVTGEKKYYWYGVHYKEAETYRNDPSATLPNATFETVTCYSSADEVELLVNGKSMGVQQNSTDIKKRNTIYWKDIPFAPGKITAIARKGGKEVARHELATTGKAVALKLETENANWKADGMDLQYVKVFAVDGKGNKVPTATGELSFDVSGAATLIAVDNGDHSSDDLFNGNKKVLHKGFAMAILRSAQTPGTVKLKVTGVGLKQAEQTLIVK